MQNNQDNDIITFLKANPKIMDNINIYRSIDTETSFDFVLDNSNIPKELKLLKSIFNYLHNLFSKFKNKSLTDKQSFNRIYECYKDELETEYIILLYCSFYDFKDVQSLCPFIDNLGNRITDHIKEKYQFDCSIKSDFEINIGNSYYNITVYITIIEKIL